MGKQGLLVGYGDDDDDDDDALSLSLFLLMVRELALRLPMDGWMIHPSPLLDEHIIRQMNEVTSSSSASCFLCFFALFLCLLFLCFIIIISVLPLSLLLASPSLSHSYNMNPPRCRAFNRRFLALPSTAEREAELTLREKGLLLWPWLVGFEA